MAPPYVHPFARANVEPEMQLFYMQLLRWLRCLIIYDEAQPEGFQYLYKFQPSNAPVYTISIPLEDLLEDFKGIFAELSRFRHDKERFREILETTDFPSEEGGTALFAMWGLTREEGLRIVGRMAVGAFAKCLGSTEEELLNMTYLGITDNDSDNDSIMTVVQAT